MLVYWPCFKKTEFRRYVMILSRQRPTLSKRYSFDNYKAITKRHSLAKVHAGHAYTSEPANVPPVLPGPDHRARVVSDSSQGRARPETGQARGEAGSSPFRLGLGQAGPQQVLGRRRAGPETFRSRPESFCKSRRFARHAIEPKLDVPAYLEAGLI